jgi:hypothetical protein
MEWRRTSRNWLKAIIMPVHKKGNIKHCENYRRINLLNSSCKIYTNIFKNNLHTCYKNEVGEEQIKFIIYIGTKLFKYRHTYMNRIQSINIMFIKGL